MFAASGSTAFTTAGGTTIFDVRALARQTLDGPGTLAARIAAFDRALARQHAPLDGLLTDGHTEQMFLEVVIAGLTHGEPSFSIRRFEVTGPAGGLRVGLVEARSCDDCPNLIEVLGHDDAIVDFFESKTIDGVLLIEGTVATARDLVRLEIDRTPDWVGPPIDVLHIDRSGVHWDERKSTCPEVEP